MTAPSKQPDTCFVNWKGKTAETFKSDCLRKTKEHQRNRYGNLFTCTLAELLLNHPHPTHTSAEVPPCSPPMPLRSQAPSDFEDLVLPLFGHHTGTSVARRLTSEHLKRLVPFPSETQLCVLFRFACHMTPHHQPVPLPETPCKGALLEPGTVATNACAAGLLSHTKCP